jgi:hypothetical protein
MPKKKRPPFFIQGKRRIRGAGTKRSADHPYIRSDGTFDPQELLEQLSDAPGSFDLLIIDHLIDKGELDPKYHEIAEEIVYVLVHLIADAGSGDEDASDQLKAIEKLTRPEKYELPRSKIKELVEKYHTRPQLARGWELRRLMSGLSFAVEPVRTDKPVSIDSQVRLLKKPKPDDRYWWERARKHWKPRSTLQSLAIRIYLARLEDEGITDASDASITERTLKRDLAEVRMWEQTTHPTERSKRGESWGGSLTFSSRLEWAAFSEGWKVRAKKKKGKTKRKRL